MVKTPARELNSTLPNSGNARHMTEYTDDGGGIYDQHERGIKGNEAWITKGKWDEDFQLW